MDLFEAIKTRKTVRQFSDDLVPFEDIEKILDAARLAPSATNSQMWHYIVILNKNIKNKIREVINSKYDEILEWDETQNIKNKVLMYKNFSTFFTDAPVNIAVVEKSRDSVMEKLFKDRGCTDAELLRLRPAPALLSIGASIENLLLAAHDLGYGACWLTAPICAYEELEKVLKIETPDKLVSFLCLGVPKEKNVVATPKKELEDIVSYIE